MTCGSIKLNGWYHYSAIPPFGHIATDGPESSLKSVRLQSSSEMFDDAF